MDLAKYVCRFKMHSYCGADVDFVDIEPTTFNISIQSLKLKLQSAERNGTLPKR